MSCSAHRYVAAGLGDRRPSFQAALPPVRPCGPDLGQPSHAPCPTSRQTRTTIRASDSPASSKLDQQRPHAVQSKHRLLIFGLSRHGPHLWLLYRGSDRPRVRGISLVRLHEGTNELRMQNTTSCPSARYPRPPMRLPHASNATRPAGRRARNSINSSRPNRRFAISPVWASTQYIWNTRFASSKPYVVAFISGPPFLKWLCRNSTLAHRCRSSWRALSSISRSFTEDGPFISAQVPWATTSTSTYAVCCCGSWITSPRSPASPSRRRSSLRFQRSAASGSSASSNSSAARCLRLTPAGWRTRYASNPQALWPRGAGMAEPSRSTRGVPRRWIVGPTGRWSRRAPVPTSGESTAAIRGWQSVRGGRFRQASAVVGSMTASTRDTLLAGNPPRLACSRTSSSFAAL